MAFRWVVGIVVLLVSFGATLLFFDRLSPPNNIRALGNDSFTKVLLHLDGANTSTSFIDVNEGGSVHAWTAAGNAQLSTAQFKFGSASGLFNPATSDKVTTPASSDFNLGASDLSIDGFFYVSGGNGTHRWMWGQSDAASTYASR